MKTTNKQKKTNLTNHKNVFHNPRKFTHLSECRNKWSDYYFLFIYGSQNPVATGAAVWDIQTQYSLTYRLHPNISIFYVEEVTIKKKTLVTVYF